jgi:hypothetical protein
MCDWNYSAVPRLGSSQTLFFGRAHNLLWHEKLYFILLDIPIIMREAITKALRVISRVLKDRDIFEWVLVGSTSLALQGVDMDPEDIDILADKKGAYEIAELLREYEIQPVIFSRSELFASHFGKFNIQGVHVEIMGDLEILTDGSWINVTADRLQSKHICKIGEVEVPVSSLEKQFEFYKKSSRKKDVITAEAIRRTLQKKV